MFRLAIFSDDVLPDNAETRRALNFLKQCEVLNVAVRTTETTTENARRLGVDGYIKGTWFCPNNEEDTIRDILAYHHIAPHDALYVGSTPPAIGRANKAGITTFCLGEYHAPAYLHQTKPRYKVTSLSEVFAVVRAQLGS
jgi:phosphoglycolate phosphatase-like HAD superfamily hydrolase